MVLAGFGLLYLYKNGNFDNKANLLEIKEANLEASIKDKEDIEFELQEDILNLKDSINNWISKYDKLLLKSNENKDILNKHRNQVLALNKQLNHNVLGSKEERPPESILTVEQKLIELYTHNPAAANDPIDITYIVPTRVRADILFRLLNLQDVIQDKEEYYSRNNIKPTTYLNQGDELDFIIHQ